MYAALTTYSKATLAMFVSRAVGTTAQNLIDNPDTFRYHWMEFCLQNSIDINSTDLLDRPVPLMASMRSTFVVDELEPFFNQNKTAIMALHVIIQSKEAAPIAPPPSLKMQDTPRAISPDGKD